MPDGLELWRPFPFDRVLRTCACRRTPTDRGEGVIAGGVEDDEEGGGGDNGGDEEDDDG